MQFEWSNKLNKSIYAFEKFKLLKKQIKKIQT